MAHIVNSYGSLFIRFIHFICASPPLFPMIRTSDETLSPIRSEPCVCCVMLWSSHTAHSIYLSAAFCDAREFNLIRLGTGTFFCREFKKFSTLYSGFIYRLDIDAGRGALIGALFFSYCVAFCVRPRQRFGRATAAPTTDTWLFSRPCVFILEHNSEGYQ